jgi:hypothetical protein
MIDHLKLFLLISVLFGILLSPTAVHARTQEWNFTVYLDEDEIGYHHFTVNHRHEQLHVTSEARFDVRFLFFTAYQYRHYNHEVWQDGCLLKVNAATDDNGEQLRVHAQVENRDFKFSQPQPGRELSGCIRSYAYWSPELLKTSRMLNTQTGEYQPVKVEQLGKDIIQVRNQPQQATRYQIRNDEFVIDVWYSDDNRWLALESSTKHGARLRYRIQ